MKNFFTLLLISVFTISLAGAQTKKASKKSVPSKSPAVSNPAPSSGKREAAPSMELQSNDIAAPNAKKLPPFRPGMLSDSLAKAAPNLQDRSEAFESPYVILAPIGSDKRNQFLFADLVNLIKDEKGIQNRTIFFPGSEECLAIAINNPASLRRISEKKEFLFLKAYTFSSVSALENSADPFVAHLRNEKSIVKLINLQNINYLPLNSEIKQSNDQVAP